MRPAALKNVTILDLLYAITKRYEEVPALKSDDFLVTYNKLRERAVDVSASLIRLGIKPGERVAIFSESRPEWAISYFGIVSAAATTVPMDIKLSETEVVFILNDSQSKCVFTSKHYVELIEKRRQDLPHLQFIFCFDSLPAGAPQQVFGFADLRCTETDTRNRPEQVKPEDTALIVYTSGTTGVAKGVELSYKNLLFEVMALYTLVHFTPKDHFISILPLNHMLEITAGLIAPLYGGAGVTYCKSLKSSTILQLMKDNRATGMVCVPLILKMFHNGIMREVEKSSPNQQRIFRCLMKLSLFLNGCGIRVGKFLFHKVHQNFGGHLRCFVCGGAPLDRQIESDFSAMGFYVLQGYGLTETSPVISVNTFKDYKFGSVGKPLPGVEVKVLKENESARDGEIIVRGPNVMKGYYHREDLTSEVIKDGWFHTGDLGYLDSQGFLFITGRIKNLIVLGGGKKVFPEEVEEVMGKSPCIKEICVLGRVATQGLRRGTEEIYAVIVPDLDHLSSEERGDPAKMKTKISEELEKQSEHLADYKCIMDFEIWTEELPKTSTRKIKRKEVLQKIKN